MQSISKFYSGKNRTYSKQRLNRVKKIQMQHHKAPFLYEMHPNSLSFPVSNFLTHATQYIDQTVRPQLIFSFCISNSFRAGLGKNRATLATDHGRRKVHDYFLLLLCKSSLWFSEKHIFKIIIYFFNTSKCAANCVILFEVCDGFIGQKILKL